MNRKIIGTLFLMVFSCFAMYGQNQFSELELNVKEVKAYNSYTKRKIDQLGKNLAMLSDWRIDDEDKDDIMVVTLELFHQPDSVFVEDHFFTGKGPFLRLNEYLNKVYYNGSRKNKLHWDLAYSTNPTEKRIFRVYQIKETLTEFKDDGSGATKDTKSVEKLVDVKVIPQIISSKQNYNNAGVKVVTKLGNIIFGSL